MYVERLILSQAKAKTANKNSPPKIVAFEIVFVLG
jgi:hypothetical protein